MRTQFLKKLVALALLSGAALAHAQLYKWVDANGKVTYSDMPPPKTAVKVETRALTESDTSAVALPYELTQAVKNMPVTLYTSPTCTPCDDGRNYLKQSGIPFSEKTITSDADIARLGKLAGSTQLPLVTVGRTQLKGYNAGEWHSSLSLAGYPSTNMLPSGYQFPTPQALVPRPAKAVTLDPPVDKQPDTPVRDPNGFQF